jgi:hypothetical protein
MLPGTFVYVNAGTQLSTIETTSDIVSANILLSFALLGVFPLIAKFVVGFIRKRRVYAGWQKPESFDYNLLVIGGGSAGLVSAYIAAAVKAKVALIEKDKMGGDCLNTGCVPSKALIRSAKAADTLRQAKALVPEALTKSSLMLGLGERPEEVTESMELLRGVGVDFLTLGQYLSPSDKHHPVARFLQPTEFDELKRLAISFGFGHVESGPLVRSSYHAADQATPYPGRTQAAREHPATLPPLAAPEDRDGLPTHPIGHAPRRPAWPCAIRQYAWPLPAPAPWRRRPSPLSASESAAHGWRLLRPVARAWQPLQGYTPGV